jgi:beta propeller repeat protein
VDAAAATGTITRLSNGSPEDQQNMPAIAGGNVVWTESETPAGGPSNFDIYYVNLTNPGVGLNLTNTPGDQEFLEDIDGTNVVWTHTSAGIAGDIVVYDLSTNRVATIASSSDAVHFEQPSIRGQWITFLRVTPAQIDVYLYDNANGTPIGLVTNDAAVQGRPRVGGGLVVFEDYTSGNADILGYSMPNGPAFAIATGPDNQITPDVDGNTVVYVQTTAGHDQLFAYDIAARTTRQLTTSPSNKVLPRISGSRIVWSDDRSGNLDLYVYDLAAGKEEPLVTGAGDQFLSDIDGARVVYTDNSSGFEQVYLFTFNDSPPPPPKLPPGCDPAKTNAVGAPVSMQRTGKRPVYAHGEFKADPAKTYYVCVENGNADGSQRTAQFSFEAEHRMVLTPADFHPVANPPRYVAAQLPTDKQCHGKQAAAAAASMRAGGGDHHGSCGCGDNDTDWSAALFGTLTPNHVTVTIRVSK